MSTATKIEWTDRTWNPVRGCSRVSPGCDNCYAMRQAHRFNTPSEKSPYHGLTVLRPKTAKRPGVDWSGRVRLVPEMLGAPLKWRKPQHIFVNSMSDLFHEALSNEEIASVFAVMAAAPQHTFQLLTKRPKRAVEWFAWVQGQQGDEGTLHARVTCCLSAARKERAAALVDFQSRLRPPWPEGGKWPLPNVWLGVSVENQAVADERIPLLLRLPAAVRFISAEPMLGPLDVRPYLHRSRDNVCPRCLFATNGADEICPNDGALLGHDIALDWVIVGGESGNGARPFEIDWARSLVKQCAEAKAACFVKQLGKLPRFSQTEGYARAIRQVPVTFADRKGGDWSEWPSELRVRQFPEVRP